MIRTSNGQLYTGITTDIQRRWQEHSSGKGGARYFRAHKPEYLCLSEPHADRSSASKREAEIKKMPKVAKEALVAHHQLNAEALYPFINALIPTASSLTLPSTSGARLHDKT